MAASDAAASVVLRVGTEKSCDGGGCRWKTLNDNVEDFNLEICVLRLGEHEMQWCILEQEFHQELAHLPHSVKSKPNRWIEIWRAG